MIRNTLAFVTAAGLALAAFAPPCFADDGTCDFLPHHAELQAALVKVSESGNGGLFKPNTMWATIVDRSGIICAVAKTGDAWPGSRVISAQKANTANAFSNAQLALSTANLYSAVQPGGSLFGLQHSNPVDAEPAYSGNAERFGTPKDPMVDERIGGVNVFGGGLALYAKNKTVAGGLGVSGDTSCTDHIIAWRIRKELGLESLPGGVSANKDDNIIFDIDSKTGKSKGGFGHPTCTEAATTLSKELKVGR